MDKTYLQIAQDAFAKVMESVRIDQEKYGILPGRQELLDIAKTAALIDAASSLYDIMLVKQRDEDRAVGRY